MNILRKVTLGRWNQSHSKYGDSGGSQCVANSASFFFYSSQKDVGSLRFNDINMILDEGDILYKQIRKFVSYNYLSGTDIPGQVIIHGYEFKHDILYNISGMLGGLDDELLVSLTEGFNRSDCLYFIYKEFAIALKKQAGMYYVFDPHSRSRRGLPVSEGFACIVKLECFSDMVTHIKQLYNLEESSQFDIFTCHVTKVSTNEKKFNLHVVLFVPKTLHHYGGMISILAANCSLFGILPGSSRNQTKPKSETDVLGDVQQKSESFVHVRKPKKGRGAKNTPKVHVDSSVKSTFAVIDPFGRVIGIDNEEEDPVSKENKKTEKKTSQKSSSSKKTVKKENKCKEQGSDSSLQKPCLNEEKDNGLCTKSSSRSKTQKRKRSLVSEHSLDSDQNEKSETCSMTPKRSTSDQKTQIMSEVKVNVKRKRNKSSGSSHQSTNSTNTDDCNVGKSKKKVKTKKQKKSSERNIDVLSDKDHRKRLNIDDENCSETSSQECKEKNKKKRKSRSKKKVVSEETSDVPLSNVNTNNSNLSYSESTEFVASSSHKESKRKKKRANEESREYYIDPVEIIENRTECTPETLCAPCLKTMNRQTKIVELILDIEKVIKTKKNDTEKNSLKRRIQFLRNRLFFFEKSELCINRMNPKKLILENIDAGPDVVLVRREEINEIVNNNSDDDDNISVLLDSQESNVEISNSYDDSESFENIAFCNVDEPLDHICCVCYQLYFKRNVHPVTEHTRKRYEVYLRPDYVKNTDLNVCMSCERTIRNGKVPSLSYVNGMKFPVKPYELDIFGGEERLIGLRLPFMRIKALPRGRQLSLFGNIINVPAHIESGIIRLPRYINEDGTVSVRIKKRISAKAVYKTYNIRPHRVLLGLKFLIENSELYSQNQVDLDPVWLENTLSMLCRQDVMGTVRSDLRHIDLNVDADLDDILTKTFVVESSVEMHTNNSVDIVENENMNIVQIENVGADLEEDGIMKSPYLSEAYIIETGNIIVRNELSSVDDFFMSIEEESNLKDNNGHDNELSNISDNLYTELCNVDSFVEIDETEDQIQFDTFIEDEGILKYLDIAPAEYETPRYIYYDENAEELAFPTIYCGLKMKDIYPKNVSLSNRLRWELRTDDDRVRSNPEKIFFMYKVYQMNIIAGLQSFSLKNVKGGVSYRCKDVRTKEQRTKLARVDRGFNLYKRLRNSPQYLKRRKLDIFAMIRQLGLPTWFISLSAADTRWGVLLASLSLIVDKKYISVVEAEQLEWKDKCRLINSDPVSAARYFDNRFHRFLNDVIYSQHNPVGKVKDHFYKIEFQHRGSPHVYMLLFCEDCPDMRGKKRNNDLCKYVDRYVSCSSEVKENTKQYLKYQVHTHSSTCRKKGEFRCRFNFPIPPFPKTVILHPLKDRTQKDTNNFSRIQDYLDSEHVKDSSSFSDMLMYLSLSELEYVRAVRSSLKDSRIFLKRKPCESRINAYMKNLIDVYKANHDIQLCLNSKAVIFYIVNYIQKSDRGVSLGLRKINEQYKDQRISLDEQIKLIGDVFLKYSEICIQECIYMILGLHMTHMSRECKVIVTKSKCERDRVLKHSGDLGNLEDDSDNIYSNDYYEDYIQRPKQLNDWCFADFICKINKNKTKLNDSLVSDEVSCDSEEQPEKNKPESLICIANGFAYHLRKKSRVLRYYSPEQEENTEEYHRILLVLFFPWNDEDLLIDPFRSYKERFDNLSTLWKEEIYNIAKSYNKKNVRKMIELLNELKDVEIETDIAPSTEHANKNVLLSESVDVTNPLFFKPSTENEKDQSRKPSRNISEPIYPFNLVNELWNLPTILSRNRSLNTEQKFFVDSVLDYILNKNGSSIQIFCEGPGGTGKSVILKQIYHVLSRHYSLLPNNSPNNIYVKCIAFTGKAAYMIGGETVHGAFGIFRGESYRNYVSLGFDRLNTFRAKYCDLKVLLIDEISLIGNHLLNFINLRLQEICGNSERFGGIHVIAFGDLYQLSPVMDPWIFENLKSVGGILCPNLWKQNFLYYPLTEIMRQKEDYDFAMILNRIRVGKHTKQDIQILNSRCFSEENEQQSCMLHLYPTNEAVNNYNKKCFGKSSTQKTSVNSLDYFEGIFTLEDKIKILSTISKDISLTGNLCTVLNLGIGLNYELLHNLDVSDGLANGTTAELKYIQYIANYDKPAILWLRFEFDGIGVKHREKYSHYYDSKIPKSWTPIFSLTKSFSLKNQSGTVHRTQFPLKQCAARTIHKSQGSTVKSVVAELKCYVKKHMVYVALSRVQSLKGLHLSGFSADQIQVDKLVIDEMKRLKKTRRLHLEYNRFEDSDNTIQCIYFNAQSLCKHYEDIKCDHDIINSDFICCVETRLRSTDQDIDYKIPDKYLYRFDEICSNESKRPYYGIIIYTAQSVKVLHTFRVDYKHIQVSILDVMCKGIKLYVVCVYRSPLCSKKDMLLCLRHTSLLCTKKQVKLIIGDFNMDILSAGHEHTLDQISDLFESVQYVRSQTTKSNTAIDLCFSNNNLTIEYHYKIWGHHNALLVTMKI